MSGARVVPVNLQAGNPLRQTFSRVVLGSSPEEMEKYWTDMYFHGISPPFVLSSQEAMLRFVAQNRQGSTSAMFPSCDVDARVRVALVASPLQGKSVKPSARAECQK